MLTERGRKEWDREKGRKRGIGRSRGKGRERVRGRGRERGVKGRKREEERVEKVGREGETILALVQTFVKVS